MNAARPSAEGFSVTDSRFSFVGTNRELDAHIGPDTQVIDLARAVVLPGLIDAHLHGVPKYPEGHRMHQVDLSASTTDQMATLVARLAKQAQARPEGDWILGFGYEDTVLGGHPDRSVLDRVSTEHPIYIVHSSGHRAVANTLALELSGVSDEVRDPPGGAFLRDADSKLNGILLESASEPLRAAQKSTPSFEELMTGVESTLRQFSVNGLTTVVDATPYRRAWLFPVYRALRDAGRLPVRVVVMVPFDMFEEFEPTNFKQDDWLSIGPVKVFHGNSLSGRTAWLSEPYLGRPEDFGIPPARSQKELNAIVRLIDEKGMQAAIHSNGDREIDMVLSAFEKLPKTPSGRERRHRIEHASVMTRPLLERAKKAGLVLALHSYVFEHGDKMEDYGASRWDWMHAHRAALDMGIPVAGNSDYPISSAKPMLRFQSLLTRRARNGKVYGAKQRISLTEAVETFTIGAAYSVFQEKIKGSITIGKLADFVVLDRDLDATPAGNLSEIGIVSTWVGGQRSPGCCMNVPLTPQKP
ncbi:MAG: amidohydrolase [Gammaproteobacteria bacterium]|nr:amidohydrolase [Gammaproteobacteria bacterium]